MMTKENRIILLSEVLESKLRKERELEYYQAELIRIQERIGQLSQDLNLTKIIIDMIETETVKTIK
jgi:hypothetical protein